MPPMLWLELRRTKGLPLSRQLYRQLVDRILAGELPGGTLLPSSRKLAAEHRIARNVVIAVYEQLLAEGFLEARHGSGTFVARLRLPAAPPPRTPVSAPPVDTKRDLVSFVSGLPDLGSFPRARWLSCLHQVGHFREPALWGYAPPAGSRDLRAAIASHLLRAKGIECTPDQIVITTGTAAALGFVAHLLHGRRSGALVEDPVVSFVPAQLRSAGHQLTPVPADAAGLVVEALPKKPRAALVFVSPSHQFPLGGTLPVHRRLALVAYARRHGLFLVEDDYDSEFRHDGSPVDSLWRLAPERVIHLGTFSKCLAPAIRIGYLVLPPDLVGPADLAARRLHSGGSLHAQEAMARFLDRGFLARHVVRMGRLYRRRCDALCAALTATFGPDVTISGTSTGLHLVATFSTELADRDLQARLTTAGVDADLVDDFALGPSHHPGAVVLAYGHLSIEDIEEGGRRIGAALRSR